MNIATHLDRIIGHLGAAACQRSFHDDRIIADHIDEALEAAQQARRILINLPPNMTSWVATPTVDIRMIGTGREPFTAAQAEQQADHSDAIRDQEIRIGQRT